MRVRRGAAIKKLLKIFLFIFSIYFTIKIFLKNTLLWPWFTKQRKKKARNSKQNTHTHTKKKKKPQKKQQIFRIKSRNDRFRMFGPHSKQISAVPA